MFTIVCYFTANLEVISMRVHGNRFGAIQAAKKHANWYGEEITEMRILAEDIPAENIREAFQNLSPFSGVVVAF